MAEKKRDRRGGVIGPLILIALGVVFLLNNLGILDWTVWEVLFRLWPILLVAAGLDLILGRRSIWGSLLALALALTVLGLALWLSGAGVGAARAVRTEEIVQSVEDVSRAEVFIDPGVGTLHVEASTGSENLIEGTLDLGRGEELEESFSVQENSGILRLRTLTTSFGLSTGGWTGRRLWDLQLTSEIPLYLETDLGLGQTELDLRGLRLESLNVEQGLGQAIVILPEEGGLAATVEGAIGQTVVEIPEGLEARIRLDTGIAARQVPDGYTCQDDVCTSRGYVGADRRLELELGQAIGSLVVRH